MDVIRPPDGATSGGVNHQADAAAKDNVSEDCGLKVIGRLDFNRLAVWPLESEALSGSQIAPASIAGRGTDGAALLSH
tara:strand:- start:432 stop:665 length:234 start_codon:yes stop_codon:yes gene_type:complete